MIKLKSKNDCCGCHACVQRCPKRCITMKQDNEGFLYPIVDESLCIECGLCEKVCPVIHQDEARKPLAVFAAKNENEEVRQQSSSGGIFTMLAEQTLQQGGVVFGARFNKQWEVVHDHTETLEGLAAFRGSKYVQSRIGNTYKKAETFLEKGRKVLFSGTPCQVAGLKKFLRKDYPNLFLVDFICHGVPSPGVFKQYLNEELENFVRKSGEKNSVSRLSSSSSSESKDLVATTDKWQISSISFRDKQQGLNNFNVTLQLAKASNADTNNTAQISYHHQKNPFMLGFLQHLYLRPSCHSCPSKQLKSGSDVTLGDYWEIASLMTDFDDDRGVSAIVVNTEAGKRRIEALHAADLRTASYDDLCKKNPAIEHSCMISPRRALFFLKCPSSFHGRIKWLCDDTSSAFAQHFVVRALRKAVGLIVEPYYKFKHKIR